MALYGLYFYMACKISRIYSVSHGRLRRYVSVPCNSEEYNLCGDGQFNLLTCPPPPPPPFSPFLRAMMTETTATVLTSDIVHWNEPETWKEKAWRKMESSRLTFSRCWRFLIRRKYLYKLRCDMFLIVRHLNLMSLKIIIEICFTSLIGNLCHF